MTSCYTFISGDLPMNKKTAIAWFLVLWLASLACIISTPSISSEDAVASAVAATLAAQTQPGTQAVSPPAPNPSETQQSPLTPTASATPSPACTPIHPGAAVLPLPAGIAAGLDENLALKNTQGDALSTRPVTGMTFMRSEQAHLAGNLAMGANALPIAYYTLQNGGTLRSNNNNILSDIAPAPNLTFLAGAEGSPFLAFVTLDMMNQWTNRLYAGNLADVPGLQPRLTWIPPQDGHFGNAILPLAVHSEAGQADGIWFTYTMVGIGDVIYPPENGLYYLDLGSNQSTEFLGTENAMGGFSPDQTLAAYGPGQGGKPGLIRNGFTVRNLVSCQETYLAFNPASNLGGGWMVFSPDNQFVAWTEASGPGNMEATLRLRVARTTGESLFDAPVANLTSFLGGEHPTGLRPAGWIANHLLVMEMDLEAIHHSILVVWAPDPSQPIDPVLGANQSFPIADGSFIGFIYP
jgi:hypothetical protein